jgi:aryl-alcohol dehydrogenase-like predicted oxidoreductase
MQNQYSLTYREEEREMNKYCEFAGIGLIPWGPLNAGQLARPWSASAEGTARTAADKAMPWFQNPHDFEKEIVGRVQETAEKRGWTMAQVAIAWINGKVTSPIIGFSSAKRMEEAIIPGYTLTPEEVKYLEEPCVFLGTRPGVY